MESNAAKVSEAGRKRRHPPITEPSVAAVQGTEQAGDRPFGQGKRGENVGTRAAPRPSAVGAGRGDPVAWVSTGPSPRPLRRTPPTAAPPHRSLDQGGARGVPARTRGVREGLEEDQLHGGWRWTSTSWTPTAASRPAPPQIPSRTVVQIRTHAQKYFQKIAKSQVRRAAGQRLARARFIPPASLFAPLLSQARAAKASSGHPASVPSTASNTRCAALKRRSSHGSAGTRQPSSSLRPCFASLRRLFRGSNPQSAIRALRAQRGAPGRACPPPPTTQLRETARR